MNQSRRKGFTLVELLVVIGIIAILISILLPTLSRVRDQAKRTACLSNLRQLGQVAHIYAIENKGWFPYRSLKSPWPMQAMWGKGEDQGAAHYADMRQLWYKYFPNSNIERPLKVFFCPSADGTNLISEFGNNNWPAPGGFPTNAFYLTGYAYYGNYDRDDVSTGGKATDAATRWQGGVAQTGKRIKPRKNKDKGGIALFGDLVEDKRLNDGLWWYVAHARGGAQQLTKISPLGMHCVTIDGSARWYAYADKGGVVDHQRSEIEPVLKTQHSTPGFYWSKPRF